MTWCPYTLIQCMNTYNPPWIKQVSTLAGIPFQIKIQCPVNYSSRVVYRTAVPVERTQTFGATIISARPILFAALGFREFLATSVGPFPKPVRIPFHSVRKGAVRHRGQVRFRLAVELVAAGEVAAADKDLSTVCEELVTILSNKQARRYRGRNSFFFVPLPLEKHHNLRGTPPEPELETEGVLLLLCCKCYFYGS